MNQKRVMILDMTARDAVAFLWQIISDKSETITAYEVLQVQAAENDRVHIMASHPTFPVVYEGERIPRIDLSGAYRWFSKCAGEIMKGADGTQ